MNKQESDILNTLLLEPFINQRIHPMNKDDIIEVDNLSELIALDATYKKYAEEK